MKRKVLIIGGGASGMMAALTAAEGGASVTILDHGKKLGRKLLATGSGRCNFTNIDQDPSCYHCSNPDFPWHVISVFSVPDTISCFLRLGIYSRNRKGYLYPYPEQSSAVLDSLQAKLDSLGVHYHLNTDVTGIQQRDSGGYRITADSGYTYDCDALIIAGGSPAGGIPGASGSCYNLAARLGHTVINPLPALVQLRTSAEYAHKLAGLRTEGLASLYIDGKPVNQDRGEIQFIRGGLSGIPIMQLSGDAAYALSQKKCVSVSIDFMPDFKENLLAAFLLQRVSCCGYRKIRDFLIGFLPRELGNVIISETGLDPDQLSSSMSEADLRLLALRIHTLPFSISGTFPAESAQTTRGGIDTAQIDADTMESTVCPDLYFAGEIVDVDGKCGGYNLQWAWSSGFLAGRSASDNSIRKGKKTV